MSGLPSAEGVDPELLAGWVAARSMARGVAAPVADHGGWRVDTRSAVEYCRYIFPRIDARIATLAATIERPGVFLKVCAGDATLMRLLPVGWAVQPAAWVMTSDAEPKPRALAQGYTLRVAASEAVTAVEILAPDGTLAASGYAAETGGVFAYDRIRTGPEHQRRGLGRALMTALRARRRSPASREILVATDQGRALYESLGWRVRSGYASALSPARES